MRAGPITLLLFGLLGPDLGCAGPGDRTSAGAAQEADIGKSVQEVLREHTPRLMAVRGVTGTGQGECEGAPCVVVFVVERSPELSAQLPDSLDGYPVDVRVSGEVRAQGDSTTLPP